MPDRPEKQSRKDKLDEWRARQRAEARAKFPATDEQMQALFNELDGRLVENGCNHTFRSLGGWAESNGVDVEALVAWCRENGGNCDCEVLANCEERWEEARRDVDW